jgi:3-methylcrotonyl-CoA carboxylase beta subunit
MRRIRSHLNVRSDDYKSNRRGNLAKARALQDLQNTVRFDRPERDRQRLERQGKLFVRERLDLLLDPGSPFLELSSLAANRAYGGEIAGGGQVAGIGVVSGREVLVHASDSAVKGGALYPLGVKKVLRAMEIALENHLPVVHLVDSAGAFLPLQAEIFADKQMGGRIFRHQCVMSAMGIEQVAVVLGHCTAGGAYIPTLSDYSIMVRGTGGVFLGGPPLVKAATGEEVSPDELGGADVHASISGTADYAVDSEAEGIALAREIVGMLKRRPKTAIDMREPEEPFYDPQEIYGIVPDDIKKQFDMREVIARIVDGSLFHEYKPDLGTTLVCGFAYLWGYKVGIIGNNGVLFSDSAHKATNFMQICDRDSIPMIFMQNITGFMIGKEYEHSGITKDGAKMLMVQANVRVPKFTVITNGSFGAGNYAMTGRAFDPRFLFSWPNSQISVMGAEQAAKTLAQIKVAALKRKGQVLSADEIAAIEQPIYEEYAAQSDAYFATSEVWDDGIIDPTDTRNTLGMAISASLNAPFAHPAQGILRV